MTGQISVREHLDRVRRVESIACPRCGAPKGRPCIAPSGQNTEQHHAARYATLYRRKAGRS